jgi:hypothetical protein
MSTLICNLPAQQVWVRREYLRDHQDGHGEYVPGVWLTAKSIPGRAFYFETYLPTYGAIYDKLPISRSCQRRRPRSLTCPWGICNTGMPWSYGIVSVVKQFTASMTWEIRPRSHPPIKGTYVCTLDSYHADPDGVDYSTS